MVTITLKDASTQALPPADAIAGSNCGLPGVWRFDAAATGPHVCITALIHGNEVCGAGALWKVLRAAPFIARGRLTIVFCNLEAYARLADANKDDMRFVDEDMNRVWGRLDAPLQANDTYEVRRAREIAPWVQVADVLLDLHSMPRAKQSQVRKPIAPKPLSKVAAFRRSRKASVRNDAQRSKL